MEYIYDAIGTKLLKRSTIAGTTTERYYAGLFGYDGTEGLKLIHTDEGIVEVASGTFDYQYFLKDHLGNTRVTFNADTALQLVDYYPFGMISFKDDNSVNDYLYNGKELQDELGMEWYDYGARMYDPQIGRWHNIDPMLEYYLNISPFHFTGNNPLAFIDPNGLAFYYSIYGTFLGDDGEDNDDIYTTNQDLITQNTNKEGSINWANVIGGDETEKIGVFGDFVNMNGHSISSDRLKQNLVGLSIFMKQEGITEEFRQIKIESGDRDKIANDGAGGAKSSYHLWGMAADISAAGMDSKTLATAAANYGEFGGVIYYPAWGKTEAFGNHSEDLVNISTLYDHWYENLFLCPVIYVKNYQLYGPGVHVDMRKYPKRLQYAGHTTKKKNDKSYTWKSWQP